MNDKGYPLGWIRSIQEDWLPDEMMVELIESVMAVNPDWGYHSIPYWAMEMEQQRHRFTEQDKAWYMPFKGL